MCQIIYIHFLSSSFSNYRPDYAINIIQSTHFFFFFLFFSSCSLFLPSIINIYLRATYNLLILILSSCNVSNVLYEYLVCRRMFCYFSIFFIINIIFLFGSYIIVGMRFGRPVNFVNFIDFYIFYNHCLSNEIR